eukprot:CAMPEP_0197829898 /NCGR_PEP_ID=MMETSP1437-20131217/6454_1 /TAXON_ID=49252 ORGANISM="Eucampia antarctica, Strain CCMP1452" /NCGR_SAMPLE_ID=MMETSP1437 /ASSEMBLY_ACC=CAM_ASM_001096 /LENGTH=52 /DNA_ID=CAMNT_0043431911 /DNA_START=240 /DNA_END=398 /DNA_ORIENTATION=+
MTCSSAMIILGLVLTIRANDILRAVVVLSSVVGREASFEPISDSAFFVLRIE